MGTLCEDIEVLNALGLAPESYTCAHDASDTGVPVKHSRACGCRGWYTKPPDVHNLRRLLDERRFKPGDFLRESWGETRTILSVFVDGHSQFCVRPRRPLKAESFLFDQIDCFCQAYHLIKNGESALLDQGFIDQILQKSSEDFEFLSHFYPRYYETLHFLLEIGCRPDHDDWPKLMEKVTRKTCHIMELHIDYACTEYFRLNSVIRLVQSTAERPLVTTSLFPERYGHSPVTAGPLGFYNCWRSFGDLQTYTGNLLPHESCFQDVEDIIFNLGGVEALNVFNNELNYDRWLLVLMSYYTEPKLRALLTDTCHSRRRNRALDFSIERTCTEILNAPHDVQSSLVKYIVFHGNVSLLQLLLQKGLDPNNTLEAVKSERNTDMLEVVLESSLQKKLSWSDANMLHTYGISTRIAQDRLFATRLLDVLVSQIGRDTHMAQTFDGFLMNPFDYDGFLLSSLTVSKLMLTNSAELPEYIRRVVQACIARYEREECQFLGGIRLYIRHGLGAQGYFPYEYNITTVENPGIQSRSFHEILQRLVSSPVFRCGLEYVPSGEPFGEQPGTELYTPLMLALYGGMIPVVEILLDAGAEINTCTPSGVSALQLAEHNALGRHPRSFRCSFKDRHIRTETRLQLVSATADDEMLEMIRNALRSRGEKVSGRSPPRKEHSQLLLYGFFKWLWAIPESMGNLFCWLFRPAMRMSIAALHERLIYIAVVYTFGLLSVARLLYLEIGGSTATRLTWILKLLSRPIVMIPVTAYGIRAICWYYLAALE